MSSLHVCQSAPRKESVYETTTSECKWIADGWGWGEEGEEIEKEDEDKRFISVSTLYKLERKYLKFPVFINLYRLFKI